MHELVVVWSSPSPQSSGKFPCQVNEKEGARFLYGGYWPLLFMLLFPTAFNGVVGEPAHKPTNTKHYIYCRIFWKVFIYSTQIILFSNITIISSFYTNEGSRCMSDWSIFELKCVPFRFPLVFFSLTLIWSIIAFVVGMWSKHVRSTMMPNSMTNLIYFEIQIQCVRRSSCSSNI